MFARQRRVAHPVSVTHTCMNDSLELSLLCSVHTATVVYIVHIGRCAPSPPARAAAAWPPQAGDRQLGCPGPRAAAGARERRPWQGQPAQLLLLHVRVSRRQECQGDTVHSYHLYTTPDPVRICIGVCPVRMPPAILLTGVTPPPPMFTRYSPS